MVALERYSAALPGDRRERRGSSCLGTESRHEAWLSDKP